MKVVGQIGSTLLNLITLIILWHKSQLSWILLTALFLGAVVLNLSQQLMGAQLKQLNDKK